MKTKLLLAVLFILIILLIIFGYLFVESLFMSFDSEGNYFDEKTITVYHEQRKEVFGILTFSLFVIVLSLINFIRAK